MAARDSSVCHILRSILIGIVSCFNGTQAQVRTARGCRPMIVDTDDYLRGCCFVFEISHRAPFLPYTSNYISVGRTEPLVDGSQSHVICGKWE